MERNVVILDVDYVTHDDKPVVRLFAKDGEDNIILIDDSFQPYLYVLPVGFPEDCINEINEELDDVIVEEVVKKDFQVETDRFYKSNFQTSTNIG